MALAILSATRALFDILPRTRFALELSYAGLAGAFLLWWVYGEKRETLRRVILETVEVWQVCLVSSLVIFCGALADWFWSPEELLKRALLADAPLQSSSVTQIQGEVEAERLLVDGRLPGWRIRYYKAGALNSGGQILLRQKGPSSNTDERDAVEFDGAEPAKRPLLLLAEPAVRKRPFMLSLRRTLAQGDIPSALITVRECYGRKELTIEGCLLTELSALFEKSEIKVRPRTSELLDTFASATGWWLLIDGIDDSGSATDMVRLAREAMQLARFHEHRLVISARRNLFEYVVQRTLSDDLDALTRDSWVIAVEGLDEDGFRRRREALEKALGRPARDGFAALDSAAADAEAGKIVRSVKQMPLVVMGIAELDSARARGPRAACVIAEWARIRQFEAHCFGELCGNDQRKAAIERTWRKITGWVKKRHADSLKKRHADSEVLKLQELDDEITEVDRASEAGRDAVLYALLGTSVLNPISRDLFQINHDWTTMSQCDEASVSQRQTHE